MSSAKEERKGFSEEMKWEIWLWFDELKKSKHGVRIDQEIRGAEKAAEF